MDAISLGGIIPADVARLSVGDYLKLWLESIKTKVEPNTYSPYERNVRLHITPHVGGIRLTKFEPVQVEGLYIALAKAGVSAILQRKVGTTLTVALNAAIEKRLLRFNPAAAVKKPKATPPEMQVLDPDQVAAFLEAAAEERLFALYLMALDTGMRPGELFALTWADIDLKGGFVSVMRALEEIDGVFRIKKLKTKKSQRRIDLARHTVDALLEHRKQMLAEGHAAGPVFCNTVGTYLSISNLHKNSFKPLLERAGLPSIRLYDLRHTCATLLLLADENPKVVSERLGHSSIHLTLDTYSHVLPTMQKRAAEKMNEILGRRPERGAQEG